jgi:hypothetical protein
VRLQRLHPALPLRLHPALPLRLHTSQPRKRSGHASLGEDKEGIAAHDSEGSGV